MVYSHQEKRILNYLKDNIDAPSGVLLESLEEITSGTIGDFKKTVLVLLREGLVQEIVKHDDAGVRTGSYLITRDGLRAVRSWDK